MGDKAEVQRSQSSVKISRNAKGDGSFEVKAYADDINEAIRLAQISDLKMQAYVKTNLLTLFEEKKA